MMSQDQPTPRAVFTLIVLLAAPLGAAAQVSTEVRLCLQDYKMLQRAGEKDAALDKLRACARDNPEEFTLQKTLGKKLAELHESSGDPAMAEEAIRAYQAAGALDPAKFSSLWAALAGLQQSLGRHGDAISSWEQAMPSLMISEKQGAQDALWELYVQAGEDEKALELWPDVAYRQTDSYDSLSAAARLHQDAERWDDAKDLWKRALDLQPGNAEAQAAYNDILAKTASSGGSADKNALLDAWLPKLGEADDAFLAELMGMTREVLNPQAERAIAREMLQRNPASPQANLSMGESLLSEGDEAGAERALKTALNGGLSGPEQGRAHAVLGRMVEQRTYARYAAAGNKTGKGPINTAIRGYDQALSHYRKAAAAGADVDDEISNVQSAKRRLGGAVEQIGGMETEAAQDACAKLSADARYGYDRSKPIERTLKGDTPLSTSAGAAGDSGNLLSGGSTLALMDARWAAGTCWVKVKASDGRSGWVEKSKTR